MILKYFGRHLKEMLFCIFFCVFFIQPGVAQITQPNVLMIVLDDLNDYIEPLNGHPQALTPNIDKLSDEGVLFTNAHSNAPLCKPSRASFLRGILPTTSLYFGNNNINWTENDVLANSKTISEYFSENGYTTYKTGKVSHGTTQENSQWDLVNANSLNYGPFAYNGNEKVIHPNAIVAYAELTGPLDGTTARLSDIPDVPADGTNPGYNGWTSNDLPFNYINDENRDAMPDENSVAWIQNHITTLDAANSTYPFFMAVGIVRPHSPFVVPDKYFDMFPIESVQIPVIRRNDRDDTYHKNGETGYNLFETLDHSYTDRQLALRKKTQAYLACVAFADAMIGQLIATLDTSEYADNTAVMLFSDHGYHVGEKQYLRKHAPWEESTRVPFIIRHPDYSSNAGETVDHPISLVDVYPTLKDLCNLTGDTKKNANGAELDGTSLKPFLIDANTNSWGGDDVALSVIYNWGATESTEQNLTIRSKKYRYTRYPNGDEELYNHSQDPYEWKNLANEVDYSSVKSNLKLALDEALVSDEFVLKSIVNDEMINSDKMLSLSANWDFTALVTGDLVNDPEQIQRTDLNDGEVIYDTTNIDAFRVEFWGIKDQTTAEYGSIKAYTSTDNNTYNEIILNSEESSTYKGYRRLFYYTPVSPLPNVTQYLKIVLTGGDQSWKGLIGSIELFDKQTFTPTDFSYIDHLTVNANPSLFDFPENTLRTNDPVIPYSSDPLADSSNLYSSDGGFYFTSLNPDDYGGDTDRLVRSNINPVAENPNAVPTPLKLVYDVDNLTYFRMEFWTNSNRTLEQINTSTGEIKAYISQNQDTDGDYTEIPIKLVKIKTVGSLMQYAVVSENEIQGDVQFLKITVTGGVNGATWSGQYGAIHLYNSSLNKTTLNLEDNILQENIRIYPNPTTQNVNIDGLTKTTNYIIYNHIGQIIQKGKVQKTIETSELGNGIFILKINGFKPKLFLKKSP